VGLNHPIAMASGIMPEATPVQLVEAAAQAGFDFGGMWIEPGQWTDATTRAVAGPLSTNAPARWRGRRGPSSPADAAA